MLRSIRPSALPNDQAHLPGDAARSFVSRETVMLPRSAAVPGSASVSAGRVCHV